MKLIVLSVLVAFAASASQLIPLDIDSVFSNMPDDLGLIAGVSAQGIPGEVDGDFKDSSVGGIIETRVSDESLSDGSAIIPTPPVVSEEREISEDQGAAPESATLMFTGSGLALLAVAMRRRRSILRE